MVPFLVGDYITYAALPKNGELLVYEASATNVQVTTSASNSVPNYIFIEDAIIGVTDNSPNVEVADSRVSFHEDEWFCSTNVHPVHWLPFQLQWRLRSSFRN